MRDVKCPYCGKRQDINHDEGHGYEEDMTHEQGCIGCSKSFRFETSISYDYQVYCHDGDHDMEPFGGGWPDMYQCKNCDFYERREGK